MESDIHACKQLADSSGSSLFEGRPKAFLPVSVQPVCMIFAHEHVAIVIANKSLIHVGKASAAFDMIKAFATHAGLQTTARQLIIATLRQKPMGGGEII